MSEKSGIVRLKPGKEKAIRHRHHWIFSGAIQELPPFFEGDILPVATASGELLGNATLTRHGSILVRMVSFDTTPPLEAIRQNIVKAIKWRESLFDPAVTNAYRLIHGEGDGLPGLIVDRYHDVYVMQLSTAGMNKLRPWLVNLLKELTNPRCIYEKSLLPSRKQEGLQEVEEILFGTLPSEVEIVENGLRFLISVEHGQKTGFFLDQREMRRLVREMSKGKRVLNCFAYSGGFSVFAYAGGAISVDTVEISQSALDLAKRNVELNGFPVQTASFHAADVFEFLRNHPWQADLVILDPPAFAKKQKDIVAACRGYKEINRLALQKLPPGSWLLSCSCSHFVDETLFQQVLFQAAYEAKRQVRIVSKHHLSADHPINIFHPEGQYLKSLLLYID